jgi:hypothetical protein
MNGIADSSSKNVRQIGSYLWQTKRQIELLIHMRMQSPLSPVLDPWNPQTEPFPSPSSPEPGLDDPPVTSSPSQSPEPPPE